MHSYLLDIHKKGIKFIIFYFFYQPADAFNIYIENVVFILPLSGGPHCGPRLDIPDLNYFI